MEDDVRNGRRFVNRQLGTSNIATEELEYRTPLGSPDNELNQPITEDSAIEELAEKITSALEKLKDAVSDEDKVDDTVDETRNTDEGNEAEDEVDYKFGDGELAELIRGVLDKIDIESSQKSKVDAKFDDDDVEYVVEDQFNVVFDNRTNEKSEDKDDNRYECSAVDNVTHRYIEINHGKNCDKIDGTEAANDAAAKHSKDDEVEDIFSAIENSDNIYYRETDDENDCKVEKCSNDYEFNDKIEDKFINLKNVNSDKNIHGRIGIEFNGKVDEKFDNVEYKVDEKFKLGDDDDDQKFSNEINDDKVSSKDIDGKGEIESKDKIVMVRNKEDDRVDEEHDNDVDDKFVNETDDTADDKFGDRYFKIGTEDKCKEVVLLKNNFDDKDEIDKRDQDDVVESKVGDEFESKDDDEVVRSLTKKKVKKGENNWLCRLNCRKEHSPSIEDFTLDTVESRVTRPTDLQKKEKLRRVRKLFGCISCIRVPRDYIENLPSLVYRMR